MTFAIRAGILSELGAKFNLTDTELGWINSMAFLGFPIAMIIGGPLCDIVGMGRLLIIAFFSHILGLLLTIFCRRFLDPVYFYILCWLCQWYGGSCL